MYKITLEGHDKLNETNLTPSTFKSSFFWKDTLVKQWAVHVFEYL